LFKRLENLYLNIFRYFLIIIATLAIVFGAINLIVSIIKIGDSPARVAIQIPKWSEIKFDVPAAGFAMVSDCGAIYEITDRSAGEVVFSENIRTSGTTPVDYAFAGVIRMQESMNRCVRNNIENFINLLDGTDI